MIPNVLSEGDMDSLLRIYHCYQVINIMKILLQLIL